MREFEPNDNSHRNYTETEDFSEYGTFKKAAKKHHVNVKKTSSLGDTLQSLSKGLAVAAAGIIIVEASTAMADPAGFAGDMNAQIGSSSVSSVQEMARAGDEHIWDEGVVIKEAGCSEKGTVLFTCHICGETKEQELDLISHTEAKEENVEATCTEEGHTGAVVCSVCGEVLVEERIIEALGHDYGPEVIIRAATCTVAGIRESTCSRCGAVQQTVIAALGHARGDTLVTLEPTCTEEGSGEIRCTRCGELIETTTVAALGHVLGEPFILFEPTCTGVGYEGRMCTRCEEVVESTSIPALGHSPGEPVTTQAATCEDYGMEQVTCTRCGEVISNDAVSPLGHIDGDHDYYCDRCNKVMVGIDYVSYEATGTATVKMRFTLTGDIPEWEFYVVPNDRFISVQSISQDGNDLIIDFYLSDPEFSAQPFTIEVSFLDGSGFELESQFQVSGPPDNMVVTQLY